MKRDIQGDFFISYTSADSRWAEWVAWQLEETGYTVVLQAWDFRPGANFVSEMDRAILSAKRTIAVLSTQYLNALYTQPEWAAAFRRDPQGELGILVPVRVRECEVTGLLGQIVFVDLAGRDEAAARQLLLAGVRHERAKPALAPAFPDKIQHTVSKQLNFPGDLPPIWNVPYPRNTLFVGREQLLGDLHTTLSTQHRAALAQLATSSDPNNIDARETAVEYTYRYQSDYHVILWANASSRQALLSDFTSVASLLNLPEKSSQEQDQIVSAVKRWLETHAYWLLVLDDAQDTALMKECIPSSTRGHVLVTTRTRSMETLFPLIEMESMKPEEQTLFLQLSRTVGATLRSPQRQLPLGLEQIAIGRAPDNQVALSDPSVSSHHAEIQLKEQRYWITDLGSTNGTFVNAQRLDPHVPRLLDPGNTIRIGNTTFTYEVNAPPVSKPPATPDPAPALTRLEQNPPPTSAREAMMGERVGQRFGNYQLVRLVGQGGFGEIYLGEHVYLDTQAAIKVLHTKLANEDIENFRQEARTIAHLVHPHIVRVLDFGVEGTTPFLVMDYAPGDTLRRLHPKGTRLPIETVVSYVKQIASALQYAHDRKVIHRDVKPENMLVSNSDEVLLSDFGIALIAQSSRYQNPLDMAGTIAYMAPEQIEAHPRPASDQYSLGIVVYEWLTGDRPFHGSFKEIAIKHSIVPPPSLCEQVPTLSPAVEQAVLIALAKDPKQRFATVQAFANAMEQASLVAEPPNVASPQRLLPPSVQGTKPPEPFPIQVDMAVPSPSEQSPVASNLVAKHDEPLVPETPAHPQSQVLPPTVILPPPDRPLVIPATVASPSNEVVSPPGIKPFPPLSSDRTSLMPSQPPTRMRGLSRSKSVLLICMALLVIAVSIGIFRLIRTNQIATDNAHATATIVANNAHATATIVAKNPYSPNHGTLVLDDPLSRPLQWNEESDSAYSCHFLSGAYHIKVQSDGGCYSNSTYTSSITFEVQMTIIAGSCGEIDYVQANGDHFSNGTTEDYYDIGVCSDGTYFDYFHLSNSQGAFGNNSFSSKIKPDLNQTNVIAMVATGHSLVLYVNNKIIDAITDNGINYSSSQNGNLYLGADNRKGAPTEVIFQDVRVWTL